MRILRLAGPLGSLRGIAGLTGLTGLASCSEGGLEAGSWLVALLALPLVAGLAYALGAVRAGQQARTDLRQARDALRAAERLHEGWHWQTDATHRLLAWQGPGQALSTACALFDATASDAALSARLRAAQAFDGLRVRSAEPLDGHRSWQLRGVPRLDDSGAFAGFVGTAVPTDDEDALRLAACATAPLLDINPQPAVWACSSPQGWQVQRLNAAAQALWPQMPIGTPLAAAATQLPAAVGEALARTDSVGPQELLGWRLTPIDPQIGGLRALLLTRIPEDTRTPQGLGQDTDTFSFTLSHDLRAPIRVVEGFTRIVKEDYGRHLDRVGNDHLDRVLGAAARMNLMIDALLQLARLSQQPLTRQRVNLSQLAGYVVEELRRAAPDRSVEVEIEVEPDLSAWGDPTLLRLVLENLLGNAWKYTSRCAHAQISLRSVQQSDKNAFAVRDNGAGFDMRSADRLFGLFQRLHSASDFPGHGVGLASVQRLVQRHGGKIWAEGEPGRGATFFFTLPG